MDTVIITPTLGDRPSLADTVDAVRRIGGARVKHVLVGPARVQASLQEKFPHCEFVAEPEKCGVFEAVNVGLKSAVGKCEIVGYINDDDLWLPNFQKLFEAFDRDATVDIAYGRVLFVDGANAPVYESTSTGRYRAYKPLLAEGLVIVAQQAALMRPSVFEKLGGFDRSYSLIADTDFWMRAVDAGFRFHYVDDVCATFMMHSGQLSANRELSDAELNRLLKQHGIVRDRRSTVELYRYRLANLRRYVARYLSRKSGLVEELMRGGQQPVGSKA